MRTRKDVFLKPLPSFRCGLIGSLLEVRNTPTNSIGFARQEEFREECLGAIIPSVHETIVSIKPLLRSHRRPGKWKQSEPDHVLRNSLDNKRTTEL